MARHIPGNISRKTMWLEASSREISKKQNSWRHQASPKKRSQLSVCLRASSNKRSKEPMWLGAYKKEI